MTYAMRELVTQNISDLLERATILDQAARQGMAKGMRARMHQADSAASAFDDFRNGH